MLETVCERPGGDPAAVFASPAAPGRKVPTTTKVTGMSDQQDRAAQDAAAVKEHFDDGVELLSAVRHTLADLLRAMREGSPGALKDVVTKQIELESALKRVFDAEQKYNDWNAKLSGLAAPGEIDLDAVRHQIGCRLARIRDCCASE